MRKQMLNDKRGQMAGFNIIFGLMILVMAILVVGAMMPIIRTSIDDLRDQDNFNCVSSTRECGTSANGTTPCYNASLGYSETTSCLILDMWVPLLLIAIILGLLGALFAGKLGMGGQDQYQEGFQ